MNYNASFYKHTSVGGFGKDKETASLYSIDKFILEDQYGSSIIYNNIKIIVVDKPSITCDIILSASMLMKMRYEIDCSKQEQWLTINADRRAYGVGFIKKRDSIYLFTSDDEK